ncbi:MAG: PAS domain-containing protein [Sphingomonadales bacterium]|nr:PAS domain-containing protein [Sphingomonadales bacterium]
MKKHQDDWQTGFSEGDSFLNYYAGLPLSNGENIPRKSEFRPGDITKLLPHVFVAEKLADDHYIVRLRGTWLEKFVGPSDNTQNVYEHYSDKARDDYQHFINTLLNTPCSGICERTFLNEFGHEYPFPTLFAPFGDEDGKAAFMIGVAVMSGYKSWQIEEMTTIFANTRFDAFRFIDLGHGAADPIY